MGTDAHGVNEILDRLQETAEGEQKVSIGDTVDALGDRGYGPLLFVPALIDISPIGGIPTLPSILALIMALMAVQIIFGREKLWLPGFLRRLSVKGERMTKATDKLRPVARWLDRWFHGRLKWLTSSWVIRFAAVLIVFLCLSVPPLELLPFATTVPMAAIASFGLALTLRDGLLMLLGFLISAVTVVVGFGLLGSRARREPTSSLLTEFVPKSCRLYIAWLAFRSKSVRPFAQIGAAACDVLSVLLSVWNESREACGQFCG